MLAAAVAAAESKQAVDLRILELDAAESSLTDYFLVMSGTNSRQIQTLADEIELRLKREFGEYANSREGYRQAEWILLDYVDFVVHIFSEEKRAYYGLERLRKSARVVSAEAVREEAVGKKAVSKKAVGAKAVGAKPVGAKPVRKKSAGRKVGQRGSESTSPRVSGKAVGRETVREEPVGAKPASRKAVGKRAMAGSAVRVAKKSARPAGKTLAGRKPSATGKPLAAGKAGAAKSKSPGRKRS